MQKMSDEDIASYIDVVINKSTKALESAKLLLEHGLYDDATSRAYYAVFNSTRALSLFDGYDYSKHSGVIAHFNQYYVKTGIFDKNMPKF